MKNLKGNGMTRTFFLLSHFTINSYHRAIFAVNGKEKSLLSFLGPPFDRGGNRYTTIVSFISSLSHYVLLL